MDFEPRQVVIAHEVVWDSFINWLHQHQLATFPIPSGDGDLPTFGIKPGQAVINNSGTD